MDELHTCYQPRSATRDLAEVVVEGQKRARLRISERQFECSCCEAAPFRPCVDTLYGQTERIYATWHHEQRRWAARESIVRRQAEIDSAAETLEIQERGRTWLTGRCILDRFFRIERD
jgi:hypothetical protein